MATTFRTDARAAALAVLTARKAASPTLLREVYRQRPGSFPSTPCAYVAQSTERITYSAQTRERAMVDFKVVVVDTNIVNAETEDRMDVLIDLLVDDYWSAYNSMGGRGLLQLTSVTDGDIPLQGVDGVTTYYRGAILGFDDSANPTFVREGGP